MIFPLISCNSGTDPPSRCEACAIFAQEFENQSERVYEKTEAEAIEVIEGLCQRLLEFKVHKEKSGLERFSRDESATMSTLKQLKERGVKIEMDFPYEMWDQPSAEITDLRQQCELIVSEYEDDLTEWFLSEKRPNLQPWLCSSSRVLRGHSSSCLREHMSPSPSDEL